MEKIKMNSINNRYHEIKNISFDGYFISLFVDSKFYKIDLRTQSIKLANSNDKIKNNYKISQSGYGIHWEEIDEDLSIDGLIKSEGKSLLYRKTKPKKLVLRDRNKKKRSGGNSR
jgi:hypothetical protein